MPMEMCSFAKISMTGMNGSFCVGNLFPATRMHELEKCQHFSQQQQQQTTTTILSGWGTFVEDTFVECTFVEGTLVEWNIRRTEHSSNGTFVERSIRRTEHSVRLVYVSLG